MEKGIVLKGLIVECGIVNGFLVEAHNNGKVSQRRVSKVMLMDLISKGIEAKGVSIFERQLVVEPDLYKSLPRVKDSLEIVDNIKSDNGDTIGYTMQTADGKTLRISITEAWKLAASGCVNDVKAVVGKENRHKYVVRKAE